MHYINIDYKKIREDIKAFSLAWYENDIWRISEASSAGFSVKRYVEWIFMDFSDCKSDKLKLELKYYILEKLKRNECTPESLLGNTKQLIPLISGLAQTVNASSVTEMDIFSAVRLFDNETESKKIQSFYNNILLYLQEAFDNGNEFEKDIWDVNRISGAHLSSLDNRRQRYLYFTCFPDRYRESVKKYLSRLILTHSFSYSIDSIMYIKRFFCFFYNSGYTDGFLKSLSRNDIILYLNHVQNLYKNHCDIVKIRYITYPQKFLQYLQIIKDDEAPVSELETLFLEIDKPGRSWKNEIINDSSFIPAPIIKKIDGTIHKLQPEYFIPVYVLLRESGWRGADIFNLRYDTCLDFVWHEKSGKYVPFLRGIITKTHNSLLKIPIRDETAAMLKQLINEAREKSTPENNPQKYLFNTYSGRHKGHPYSKTKFVKAVQELIDSENIVDSNNNAFHFRTHALRHTRAVEYIENGMPLTVIKSLLGHSSINMTLHYAKVSDSLIYTKWMETETKLSLPIPDISEKFNISLKAKDSRLNHADTSFIKIPLGTCTKSPLMHCKNAVNRCLDCGNFQCDKSAISYVDAEIHQLEHMLSDDSPDYFKSRNENTECNREYLKKLYELRQRILSE